MEQYDSELRGALERHGLTDEAHALVHGQLLSAVSLKPLYQIDIWRRPSPEERAQARYWQSYFPGVELVSFEVEEAYVPPYRPHLSEYFADALPPCPPNLVSLMN